MFRAKMEFLLFTGCLLYFIDAYWLHVVRGVQLRLLSAVKIIAIFLPFEIFEKVLTDLQFASDLQPLISITTVINITNCTLKTYKRVLTTFLHAVSASVM
jgi:hypothetical protein